MELALALDPGRTTGYAAVGKTDRLFLAFSQASWDHSDLAAFLRSLRPSYIVCEDFDYRRIPGANVDLYPVELIGVLRLINQTDLRLSEVYMQKPSVQGKKAYWTDDKLKEMDLYVRGLPHGHSALKHLLDWMSFRRGAELYGSIETVRYELVNFNWLQMRGGDNLGGS